MKNSIKIAILGLYFALPLIGMDAPLPNKQQEISNSQAINIKRGFGENFDFASCLKPENDSENSIYLRRLKAFKHFLFDFVFDLQRPSGNEFEKSGSIPIFLFDFLKMAQNLRICANAIPMLHGEIVTHFVPARAMKPLKIPIRELSGFEFAPIIPSSDVIYDNARPMANGISGIMPLCINNTKSQAEIAPLYMSNKFGKFAIAPHRFEPGGGKTIIGTKLPVYLITEEDAESIALTLNDQRMSKLSRAEKIKIVQELTKEKNLSDQANRILACALYNFSTQTINDLITKAKEKTKFANAAEDHKAIQNCCFNCPHILSLSVFQKRLISGNQNFLVIQVDGKILFSHTEGNLFNEIHEHLKVYSELEAEYTRIYNRVQEEIKSIKKSRNLKAAEKIKYEKCSIPTVENQIADPPKLKPVPKIKYAKRVLRWFKESFSNRQKQSSVLYHALLPLLADPILITHGSETYYNNKTYAGQKDNHYSIAGKIIDEKTNEESFCVFRLCIDPKGICYHRECSKCDWESLEPELQKSCAVEEESYSEDDEGSFEADKAAIISDTQFSTTIINPRFKHRIVLYKKQF